MTPASTQMAPTKGCVVVAPPSVVLQWQSEMECRFGLPFAVMNRESVSRMRRERGRGVNPWATHTRLVLSQALVPNEDYAGPSAAWLAASSTSCSSRPRPTTATAAAIGDLN